jgi:hypothetical protein
MAEPSIVSVAEISIAMATGILAFFTYRLANITKLREKQGRHLSDKSGFRHGLISKNVLIRRK